MTDRRNRELVLAGLRELPTAYEALEYQVARSGCVQVPSRGEPPIPIPTAVMDLMIDFETQILRLHSRALVVLGWHLPPVKLARKGQYIACPVPGCGALARHAAGSAGRAGRGPLPRLPEAGDMTAPSPELRPVWDGPTEAMAAGVDLPACTYCRRAIPHKLAEHVALVGAAVDPLASAAVVEPSPRRTRTRKPTRRGGRSAA